METSDHYSGFSDPQISRIEIHKAVNVIRQEYRQTLARIRVSRT